MQYHSVSLRKLALTFSTKQSNNHPNKTKQQTNKLDSRPWRSQPVRHHNWKDSERKYGFISQIGWTGNGLFLAWRLRTSHFLLFAWAVSRLQWLFLSETKPLGWFCVWVSFEFCIVTYTRVYMWYLLSHITVDSLTSCNSEPSRFSFWVKLNWTLSHRCFDSLPLCLGTDTGTQFGFHICDVRNTKQTTSNCNPIASVGPVSGRS